ncbi:Type I secretion system protein TolC [Psychromonas sp. PT13]|uniref:Type I secretion system protein TolC n=1 Tax=Psychromonas sp. PT13 TaxID=3439547 RepID=UPI003EBED021
MTQSRQSQASLSDTPYYYCISRCVRRAYLCGEDKYTERSFEHRRQWVVERMNYLASANCCTPMLFASKNQLRRLH